jgi:hypothetical protein
MILVRSGEEPIAENWKNLSSGTLGLGFIDSKLGGMG